VRRKTLRSQVAAFIFSRTYSYTCDVDAELAIKLSVVGRQTLEGDHWSTKLLKGIMEGKLKRNNDVK
jgi:hypothetical protein